MIQRQRHNSFSVGVEESYTLKAGGESSSGKVPMVVQKTGFHKYQEQNSGEVISMAIRQCAHKSDDSLPMVVQSGRRAAGKPRQYEGVVPAVTQDYGTGGGNVPMVTAHPLRYPDRNQKNFTDIAHTVDSSNTTGVKITVHNLQKRDINRPSTKKNPSAGGSGQLSREDGNTFCIDRTNLQAMEPQSGIRRLTERECERLQGFPDDWTAVGLFQDGVERPISGTQRYRQCGNAVSTSTIAAIGRVLLPEIQETIANR